MNPVRWWCRAITIAPLLAAFAASIAGVRPAGAADGAGAPAGFGSSMPVSPGPCLDDAARERILRTPEPERPADPPAGTGAARGRLDPRDQFGLVSPTWVLFAWPLAQALDHGVEVSNYVDHDATAAIKDHYGLPHSYNGHNGTDIAHWGFRDMDRGLPVYAASPGQVTQMAWANWDRSIGPPYLSPNYIIVRHADLTEAWYFHFRTASVSVNIGEMVQAGAFLGMMGSSGQSTGSHLHFEAGSRTPGWTPRDPWNGPNNPLSSLWQAQEPYQGNRPLSIFHLQLVTQQGAGGNLNAITDRQYKEGFTSVAVLGQGEPYVALNIALQGNAGDTYRAEILRPNQSLWGWADGTLGSKVNMGYHYWYWNFASTAPAAGTWTARVKVDNVVVRSIPFTVGAATQYMPRCWPRAGRSFRLGGGVPQLDTLRVQGWSGPVTWSLPWRPPFVTLSSDSIVTIGATSPQSYRSLTFQAIATDGAGRRDTMWYHVVDPSKPHAATTGVTDGAPAPDRHGLAVVRAAAGEARVLLRATLARPGTARLRLFAADGRLVATPHDGPLPAGTTELAWEAGRAPSGVYFARLDTADGPVTARIVRVQ